MSRFNSCSQYILNVKDAITKSLQSENHLLRNKFNILKVRLFHQKQELILQIIVEDKTTQRLMTYQHQFSMKNWKTFKKVVEIFKLLISQFQVITLNLAMALAVNKVNQRKLLYSKILKSAIHNRRKVSAMDKIFIGLDDAHLFINENLSLINNEIAFRCRKLRINLYEGWHSSYCRFIYW